MTPNVCAPMPRLLAIEVDAHSQEVKGNSGRGSLLQIPPVITILHVTLGMMRRRSGLSREASLKNGKETVPSYGSVANVRSSRRSYFRECEPLIPSPISQRVRGKLSFGMRRLNCLCVKEWELIPPISSAIIEEIKSIREAKSSLIAYHYFDFKDASTRNIRGLLASLLFQLSDDSERCCDVLNRLYFVCHDGSDQPTDVALARCLNSMLKLPGQLPIFIIIDALDECPDTDGIPSAREEVLNVVKDLVGSNHSNLFLCITSRPEQDIKSVLNPLTSALFRVSLHEEGGQRGDINAYVRSFVYQDRAMRRWSEGDKELVIGTLSQQANGV